MTTSRGRLLVCVMGLLVLAGAVHAATVATPTFSKAHGFYSGTISVTISTATAGATIRYTTDGTAPSASVGTVYSGAVSLNDTRCLRAIAVKAGYTASETFTQTYVFLDKVPYQPANPAGFPSQWKAVTSSGTVTRQADYEMDPEIRNKYGVSQLKTSLKALPTMSIAIKTGDLFTTAVYGARPPDHGTERACSVEFWYGDNPGRGFQINCALRAHSWAAQKRAFRIKFKSPFGPTSLEFPIFEQAPQHATSKTGFDKLVLRSGLNRNFAVQYNTRETNYTRDQWVRDTQIAMSGTAARGTFCHLYINGLYWGLYNITERPDHKFNSQWRGGSPSDWHARHHAGTISGSGSRFDTAVSKAVAHDYSGVKNYLDVNQYCDYIIANWYCGTGDWPGNNWYAGVRNNPPGKTIFLSWDAEDCWDKMGSDRVGRSNDGAWVHPAFRSGTGTAPLDKIWHGLKGNSQFIKDFSARVDLHCYDGGALTEANCKARWDRLCSSVRVAIYAESARWGDGYLSSPVTYEDWVTERDLARGRMTGNVQRFINALKAYNYYVPAVQPPAAPSSLAASATSSTAIKVTWTDNSSDETQFKVERSLDGSSGWSQIAAPGANTTVYTDSGLSAGTKYYYRVRAANSAGNSGYSNVASATTSENAPSAPSGATATAQTSTSIRVTWQDNSSSETGFKIDRRQSGTDPWVRITQTGANVTSYTDSGLAAATTYYYKVKATSSAGDSGYSNVAGAQTQEGLPAQPSGVAATALSTTQIKITWVDNSSNETQFKIRRSLDGVDFYVLDPLYPAADATTVTDAGLTPGTTYYYMMRAEGAAGVSVYTDPVSATTQAGVPAAPSALTATAVSSSQIDLTWQDNSSNETTFKIDRRQSGTSAWVRIAAPGADATACSDAGLPAETHFYYKVKAANSAGDSAYSSVAAATTEPDNSPEAKIEKGATWRYRKGTAEATARPEMWRTPGFDDSGWSSGAAPFGYGGLTYGTKLADMCNSYSCVFLRKAFAVADPAVVSRLDLDVDYDDGFIMWVNGEEVARVNVQGATGTFVAYDQTCTGYVKASTTNWSVSLSGAALPALGTGNILAVQLLNNNVASGDAILDAALSVVFNQLPVADDADRDVMPDDWETDQLGGTGESAGGDKDGDGMSNLEEYIAGTDPLAKPAEATQGEGGFMVDVRLSGGHVIASFQTIAAAGPGYEGKTRRYALEQCTGSSQESTWTAVSGYERILGAGQDVVYTNTAPGARTFFRGRVWLEE
ncbi:MAG: fibronectin type III domain-containing protein [Kiritimatiellae bacterium]|nr:fibronectin type III domain-containing protein [Kiritimatiellia bacterium]